MTSALLLMITVRARADDLEVGDLAQLSLEELLEVEVVTATKSAVSVREAPAAIAVITAQQIRERGYQSVGEALQSVSGLDLLHDHFQYNLGVRGVSPGNRAWSRSVKVMVDGQPVSFRATQENFLGEELIPIQAIERIEIIKGPASVLYGANAYLGVVNIITKSGEDVEWAELGVRHAFGPRLTDPQGSAIAGAASGGWDVVTAVAANSPAHEGYRLQNPPGEEHPLSGERSQSGQPVNGSAFGRVQYQSERAGKIALDFNYQRLDRYSEFMDWGVMAHDNRQSLYNMYVRLRYSRAFAEHFEWNVGVAHARGRPTAQDRLNVASGLNTHVERDFGFESYDVFSDLTYRFDDIARLTLSSDFTQDQQDVMAYSTVTSTGMRQLNPPAGTRTTEVNFSNIGVSLHAMVSPFMRSDLGSLRSLQLSAGVRYDRQNIYGDNINYSAAAVYQMTDHLYTKLLYGTSFRAPAATQLYSNFIETGGAVGNPDLSPERAKTLELAIGGSFLEYFTLELNGFVTRIDSKVETRPPPASSSTSNSHPQNIGDIESIGGEAQLSVQSRDVSAYANYAYQKSTYSEDLPFAINGRSTFKSDVSLYPSHVAKLGITYRIPVAYLQASLEGRYIGARIASERNNELVYGARGFTTQQYALDAYGILDVVVSSYDLKLWKDRETRITGKVYNLLGTDYAFPGYSGFDIPGFARSYMISFSQQL